jgi:hypothetical protein
MSIKILIISKLLPVTKNHSLVPNWNTTPEQAADPCSGRDAGQSTEKEGRQPNTSQDGNKSGKEE